MKTKTEILQDVYKIVKASAISGAITGKVSYNDDRADDATTEDCMISLLTNQVHQIQDVTVNVNVYFEDIESGGRMVLDSRRSKELERICVDTFGDGKKGVTDEGRQFRISLKEQNVLAVEGKDEHVINNKLRYQFNNE